MVAITRRKEDQRAGDFLWFIASVGRRRAGELAITYLLILSDILTTSNLVPQNLVLPVVKTKVGHNPVSLSE